MPTQFMSMSSKALNRFHDFHLVLGDAKQQQSRRPIHIGVMVYLANECCPGEQHCGRNVILNCSIYRLALVQTYKVAPFLCSKEVCRIFQTHVMTSHTPQPDQNHRDQNHDAAFCACAMGEATPPDCTEEIGYFYFKRLTMSPFLTWVTQVRLPFSKGYLTPESILNPVFYGQNCGRAHICSMLMLVK